LVAQIVFRLDKDPRYQNPHPSMFLCITAVIHELISESVLVAVK